MQLTVATLGYRASHSQSLQWNNLLSALLTPLSLLQKKVNKLQPALKSAENAKVLDTVRKFPQLFLTLHSNECNESQWRVCDLLEN